MSDQYNILLHKLDVFIKKYYFNEIIKGGLFFLSGVLSVFLFFVLLEYLGYFNTKVRTILYFSFLLFTLVILYWFLMRPILGLLKIGKSVDIQDAAYLLGKFFSNEVDDKIINTIQLKKHLDSNSDNTDLILASIDQKSKTLIPIPFSKAINYRSNLRFLPPAIFVLAIILIGWILFPFIFRDPAVRLINFSQHYERPAPFSLTILNEKPLVAVKNQGYKLKILADGNVLPEKIELIIGKENFAVSKLSKNEFEFDFRSIVSPVRFYLKAGNYNFGPYDLDLMSRALIKNFTLTATYPQYTGKSADTFVNVGDLNVPDGTKLKWNIFTDDTYETFFKIDTVLYNIEYERTNVFSFSKSIFKSLDYSILVKNESSRIGDSLNYYVKAIPDQYPVISVVEYQDSIMLSNLFFRGLISDDYGFTNLAFVYRVLDNNRSKVDFKGVDFSRRKIEFDSGNLNQSFYYHVNLLEHNVSPGLTMEYYFEVSDNDQINGPKSAQSRLFSFSIPDYFDLISESLSSDEEIKSGITENIAEVNSIQDEIDNLRRSILESENISWEQQQSLKNLLDKQQKAQEKFEEWKEFSENKTIKDQQFRKQDEDILRKQDELQKLFDDVLTDELKDLYKQIQDELEKLNKENLFDVLNRMEFEMQDFENRLDRALELFKQLQVERMLSESINFLDDLKKQQDVLTDNIESSGISEQAEEEQSDINEKFESLKDLLNDMQNKNSELSRPNDLDDTSGMEDRITEDLNDALEQIKNSDSNQTQQKQKGASDKMDQLSKSLKAMQAQMQQENLAEDIRTLREILDNLLKTSFAQEGLLDDTKVINIRDPKYVSLIQNQRKLRDDLEMIKDSLQALAKRQIQIESIVTREIAEINFNINQAIEHLVERRKHTGLSRQQFVMTHINNLALLLNESLQNMQMQMDGQGEGGDPQAGEGQPGFPDLRQMQEQMNQMLEQLRDGNQPMPGESGQQSMGISEQLARMAAEQEAIRNKLNELSRQLGGDGEDTSELEQLMREMERTELEIITNSVSRQTVLRQQRILSRLLEHERAQLEREQEERRVGETAKFYDLSNPERFFEYNREKNRAIDMMRNMPPGFRPHYKSLVELYFLNVQE